MSIKLSLESWIDLVKADKNEPFLASGTDCFFSFSSSFDPWLNRAFALFNRPDDVLRWAWFGADDGPASEYGGGGASIGVYGGGCSLSFSAFFSFSVFFPLPQ